MLATGIDIVEIRRIEKSIKRSGDKFILRILSKEEYAAVKKKAESIAGLFAAKEAVAKALGTGIGPKGVSWQDIELLASKQAPTKVKLKAGAKRRFEAIGAREISISISHEEKYAVALAVITG